MQHNFLHIRSRFATLNNQCLTLEEDDIAEDITAIKDSIKDSSILVNSTTVNNDNPTDLRNLRKLLSAVCKRHLTPRPKLIKLLLLKNS